MKLIDVNRLELSYSGKTLLNLPQFGLNKAQIHGIIGESGSGKSLFLLAIMGLLPKGISASGVVEFADSDKVVNLINFDQHLHRKLLSRNIGMVFQEPMSALNPRIKCGLQIDEALALHSNLSFAQRKEHIVAALKETGLADPERIYNSFPHQISGGQRQRVMIVLATINAPELVLADEPTTALDPETGKKILETLVNRCKSTNSALILVSHDLQMVAQYAELITVLKKGALVAQGLAADVLRDNQSAYVAQLLASNDIEPAETPAAADVVLEVKNLQKSFHLNGKKLNVLKKLGFQLRKGETLAIVGPSGSGKSTIAKVLTRLEHADSGQIFINGNEWNGRDNNGIQMVFQDPYSSLNNEIRNIETVAEVLRFRGKKRHEAEALAKEMMADVGLDGKFAYGYPHQLSGGQRQRLCIARALASEPGILILDESVAALDPLVKKTILELLKNIQKKRGVSYLFITHDEMVANRFSNRKLDFE